MLSKVCAPITHEALRSPQAQTCHSTVLGWASTCLYNPSYRLRRSSKRQLQCGCVQGGTQVPVPWFGRPGTREGPLVLLFLCGTEHKLAALQVGHELELSARMRWIMLRVS
jgi:hypothetical protein